MVVKINLVKNAKELQENEVHRKKNEALPKEERADISELEAETIESELILREELISRAYNNQEGGIVVTYGNEAITILYNDHTWNEIEAALASKK